MSQFNTSAQPQGSQRAFQVPSELSQLETACNQVAKLSTELMSRLSGVLRDFAPPPAVTGSNNLVPLETRVPLAGSIHQQKAVLDEAIEILQSILNRIEL